MLQHRIIEIFITFSKNDVKRFRDYLNSPFFNKSEKTVKLFEALICFHPDFKSKNLTDEKIFKKVNPELIFNNSTFRNQLFDLSNAADNFFSVINFCESDFDRNDFLRDEQFKRKLSKQLEAGLKKEELSLNEAKSFSSEYFMNKFKLSTDILNFNLLFKPRSGHKAIVSTKDNLTEHGKNITAFFIKEIFRVFDNLLTLKKSFDIKEEDNYVMDLFKTVDFEKILSLLMEKSGNDTDSKIFRMYLARYLAFTKTDNEKYYFAYRKLVMNNTGFLSIEEMRSHTINLIRYCMLKSRNENCTDKDKDKFNKERFDIYCFILNNNYYKIKVSGYIPLELFLSILRLSLDLKKYSWAYDFIKKYRTELPPDRRENIFYYSCAQYFFSRGRYEESMKNFSKVKYDHLTLKLEMKNLMLRTFYELDLYEKAFTLIDTYRHFLSNDKTLSPDEKRKNKNFMNVIHKMLIYKTSENKTGRYIIENELKRDFPHKEWALEKFEYLDKKVRKSA